MHKKTIREYAESNAQAANGLEERYQIAKAADWASFADLRNEVPATDLIGGDRFVFNIRGNHYRLLAAIVFKTRTILIRGIFTHAEYSKLSKTQLLTRQSDLSRYASPSPNRTRCSPHHQRCGAEPGH